MLAPTRSLDLHHLGQAQPGRGQGGLSERRHPRHRGAARRARTRRARARSPSPADGRLAPTHRRMALRSRSPARTGFVGRHVADSAGGSRLSGPRARPRATIRALACTRRRAAASATLACRRRARCRGATRSSTSPAPYARRDRASFHAVNAGGTARLAAAAAHRARLFIQVSSLAARLPAALALRRQQGRGRAAGAGPCAAACACVVVRPPAVYGPDDRPTLPLLRGLDARLAAYIRRSRDARFSLLYAQDLAQLVLRVACGPAGRAVRSWSRTTARPGGYGWPELAAIAEPTAGAQGADWSACRAAPCLARHGWPSSARPLTRPPPILSRGKVGRALPSRLGERYARHGGGGRLAAADPASATAWRPPWPGTARRAGSSVADGRRREARCDAECSGGRTTDPGGVTAVLERYNTARHPIVPSTDLAADLNVDSVAAMDLIMEIEDRFEIDIPINLVSDMTTVARPGGPGRPPAQGARGALMDIFDKYAQYAQRHEQLLGDGRRPVRRAPGRAAFGDRGRHRRPHAPSSPAPTTISA